jgi:hypothetical protein
MRWRPLFLRRVDAALQTVPGSLHKATQERALITFRPPRICTGRLFAGAPREGVYLHLAHSLPALQYEPHRSLCARRRSEASVVPAPQLLKSMNLPSSSLNLPWSVGRSHNHGGRAQSEGAPLGSPRRCTKELSAPTS